MEKIKAEFCVFLSQVALRVLANTTVPATTEEGEDQLSGLLDELERWKGSATPFWESTADLREKIVSFVDN
ncbi:hypothetical protein AGDE_14715 [Angomonas deanei]|nr:hypothetical protein AGDE_14715 [Angomonas deanei]|eukprot:EPY20366.1 hypothetical protein AGDE_14715 [Angomonas deanei]